MLAQASLLRGTIMEKQRLQEVFHEPDCGVNRNKTEKQKKAGCTKQLKPGAAAGGCAFDGAKIALQPVADAIHLVHGPIACEGNSWDNRGALSSGPELYKMGFTTDLQEFDVIYGGEKKLYQSIKEIIQIYHPPAIFVYQTCVPALIGDDVRQVCELATKRFETPVVPVISPGFAGSKNLGNKLAGEALLEYVIGTGTPAATTGLDVNLIGEYNLAGELWQIKKLFDRLGIRVLSTISGDGRYNDIASSHHARVSMLVCSKAMINIARKMKERYDIPYFEGSFYGISDTSDALRTMTKLLVERGASPSLIEEAEALIASEEEAVWKKLSKYRERLKGKRVLVITGGVKSWSVVSALKEIGMEIVGTSVKKSTDEDKERIQAILGPDAKLYGNLSGIELYRILKNDSIDIMLSGGRTQFLALKAFVPWIDINQERHHAYATYDGMVSLVDQIDRSIHNPIWNQLRSASPKAGWV